MAVKGDALVQKIAALARSTPHQWNEFLVEFKKYSIECAEQCVAAPLANLQVMQGRAQQCAALLKTFETAVITADRIASKQK